MKIVRIFGGLGNQMFQYALAVSLKAERPNEPVYIDASCMRGYPLHNGYELDRIFNAEIGQASLKDIAKVAYPLPHYRLWQFGKHFLPKRKSMAVESKEMEFLPDILGNSEPLLLEGYWQTERYFKAHRDQILRAFSFPDFESGSLNERLAAELKDIRSLSLHIRRGDYLKISNTSGICTMQYYEKAMTEVLRQVTPEKVVVFSDDSQWCKDNLQGLLKGLTAIYVDWNNGKNSFRDMQLMNLCSHNIIANSSFSWWGAWLNKNPDKIVVAPSRWMNGPGWPDIIPEDWTKM